jgi:DinB superfamily
VERCEVCGFAWEAVAVGDIDGRLRAGTQRIAELLTAAPDRATVQPTAGRWSALEYAGHVRDVLLMLRDRMVVGMVEDEPEFKPMYRDQRVDHGLYAADSVASMTSELPVATELFTRLFAALAPGDLQRPVRYGFPDPERRTLLWMGQQAVHEVEHHGSDIAENLGVTG